MRVVPYQEIMKEKLARQEKLKEMGLQLHASGHCAHLGKISPGCRKCFTGEAGSGIQVGNLCMYKCPYCYYDVNRGEMPESQINNMLADYFFNSLKGNYNPTIFSYQSAGETLTYADYLEQFAVLLDNIEQKSGINQYRFMYTNGILADEEMLKRMKYNMGVDEIRFHVSASDFDKEVFKNMEMAAKMDFFVTVEEPSWMHHRKQLFELLPFMDSIGAKHLDMVEVQISPNNRAAIEKAYPGSKYRAYKDYFYHLYDEGLVYDIMEEVISKGYKFSVIDCNSAVERCRHNRDQDVLFDWESIRGMCADWDYGFPNLNF